jgi:hypothetical protein
VAPQDANIAFEDLRTLLRHLGFAERVRGSHHIFTRDGVVEILNLQPQGSQAKAYQVRQVRGLIVSNNLADEPEAEPHSGKESSGEEPKQPTSEEQR